MRQRVRISEVPFVTVGLIIVNAVIFLLCTFKGDMLYNIGWLSPVRILREREYYRMITAMFLHADIEHIVYNMLLLGGIGYMIEKEIGHWQYGLLYLGSGIGGHCLSLAYKVYTGNINVPSIGASGAVYGLVGVLLAMSILWPRRMPNVSWQKVIVVTIFSIYSGVRGANIDNAAHIGGFATGFLLGVIVCLIGKAREKRKAEKIRNMW